MIKYSAYFRKDRGLRRGGGVALYVEQSLSIKRRDDFNNGNIEVLWVEIKLRNLNLLCGVCYRP
ncbi:MAG: hypothetical protein AAF960_21985, partial [Bacteroidota bacterium]